MKYGVDYAAEEIGTLELILIPIVERYLEEKKPIEVAKALAILNKELYRYEEEARRLRLTGELDIEIYKTIISGYRGLSSKILQLSYKCKLAHEVSTLQKALRFSSEIAGIYLAEYLESATE
ncbi:MAG: hypothetical protein H3Z51_02855 [archaeon]|nr:hypothetical protein [archaeon]